MSFRIVVLAKQVPDTRNVGKDAMKEDGTINRAALPAIYNPEDLNALEMAIEMKERIKDAEIVVVTMGPGRAAEIVLDQRHEVRRCRHLGHFLYLVDGFAQAVSLQRADLRPPGH